MIRGEFQLSVNWRNSWLENWEPLSVTTVTVSTPLFRLLATMKLSDLVTFHIALFMHKIHNKLLPSYFDSFFNPVLRIHNYNTRSAANQSYYLPRARTNYGIFNIRFQGPKVWNSLGKDIKSTPFGPILMPPMFFIFPRAMSFFPANSMIYLLLFVFKFSIYHNYSGSHYIYTYTYIFFFFSFFSWLVKFRLCIVILCVCAYVCVCVCCVPTLIL